MRLLRLQLLLEIGTASGARTAAERRVHEVVVLRPAEEQDVRLLESVKTTDIDITYRSVAHVHLPAGRLADTETPPRLLREDAGGNKLPELLGELWLGQPMFMALQCQLTITCLLGCDIMIRQGLVNQK